MPTWFLRELDSFLEEFGPQPTDLSARVLLTGEYTPFNLLGDGQDGAFELTGMIDFGDAMLGAPQYDLLGPSLFLAAGHADRVGALFSRYFGAPHSLGPEERNRLLALAVLHRYSNLDGQIARSGWRKCVRSFQELAEWIWP